MFPHHVTIASTQKAWHGGEQQALLLAEGMRTRGIHCTILARANGSFATRMSSEGFEVRTFSGRGLAPRSLMSIRKALARWQPSVLVMNDGHALRACGFGTIGLRKPLRVAARRVDFPIRWPIKFTQFADGVICVSRVVAEVCIASGLPNKMIEVVHDGVDPGFAAIGDRNRGRNELGLSLNDTLLLCVAKLTDHKGHRYLIEAMPQILAAEPTAQLVLAGDGELRESLEQRVAGLGIESRVRFLGFRDDVPDLLAAADVVVQPSHMEGLCSSLIDAMFAKKAIVATRAGGIPDLFEHTNGAHAANVDRSRALLPQIGSLVPTKCPESLAAAIVDVLSQPEVAQRMGELASEHARVCFTDNAMVVNTLNAFERLRMKCETRQPRHAA